jgi:hypothetical protein
MKLNAAPLILGIGVAISAAAANPACAQSTTAFGSFHVQSSTVLDENPYLCLTEDNGAVVNNCTSPVNLFFNLPIKYTGEKTISVRDYWNGPDHFDSFNCVSYVYLGKSSVSNMGTQVTFDAPLTALTTKDDVTNADDTLAVICWQVPPKEGIASLKWNE